MKEKIMEDEIIDRRFKDLVDVFIALDNFYPNATKAQILSWIEDEGLKLSGVNWKDEDSINKAIQCAKNFRPKPKLQSVFDFQVLITGLLDDNILDSSHYREGRWF
jgi:hypothetical protein